MMRSFSRLPRRRALTHTALAVLFAVLATGSALAAGGVPAGVTAGEYTTADVVLLVIYIIMALLFSFLCSVAEAVLLSITPSYVASLKEENPKRAALLKKLKEDNVDRSLAAILTLNTIAHTVGAIGSGIQAAKVFGDTVTGTVVFPIVMTLAILFLSEIIPKTLGAVHWRGLAGITATFIKGLILILYPLILVSELLTRLIAKDKSVHAFSRDEFIAMASVGAQGGHLKEGESRILKNLFRFESLTARDVMTPRTVVVALQKDITVAEALESHGKTPFSRLPLFNESLDDVAGFVLKDELLLASARGKGDDTLETLQRPIKSVVGTMPLSKLLEFLLDERMHLGIVVDEYGGTAGLVSLEDVVETLLGLEIVDEADHHDDMQALARRQWKKRAQALGLEVDESI